MTVGVLAIQGDFAAHARMIERAGHHALFVRRPEDFAALSALVLPGGESTAMLHGIRRDGLDGPLRNWFASGRPVLATCAGAILAARRVTNPGQSSFDAIDVDVERNAYGTQIDSFAATAETHLTSPFAGLRCIFIRAPRITRTGPSVSVHACVRGVPVLVSAGPVWAATFHPELTDDTRVLAAVLASDRAARRVSHAAHVA